MPWSMPLIITALAFALGVLGGGQAPLLPRGLASVAALAAADLPGACPQPGGDPGAAGAVRHALAQIPLDAGSFWAGLALGTADSAGAATWRAIVAHTKHRPPAPAGTCAG